MLCAEESQAIVIVPANASQVVQMAQSSQHASIVVQQQLPKLQWKRDGQPQFHVNGEWKSKPHAGEDGHEDGLVEKANFSPRKPGEYLAADKHAAYDEHRAAHSCQIYTLHNSTCGETTYHLITVYRPASNNARKQRKWAGGTALAEAVDDDEGGNHVAQSDTAAKLEKFETTVWPLCNDAQKASFLERLKKQRTETVLLDTVTVEPRQRAPQLQSLPAGDEDTLQFADQLLLELTSAGISEDDIYLSIMLLEPEVEGISVTTTADRVVALRSNGNELFAAGKFKRARKLALMNDSLHLLASSPVLAMDDEKQRRGSRVAAAGPGGWISGGCVEKESSESAIKFDEPAGSPSTMMGGSFVGLSKPTQQWRASWTI